MDVDENSESDTFNDALFAVRSTRIRKQQKQRLQQQQQREREQQNETVSMTRSPRRNGPYQAISYYLDNNFINMHSKRCSKCQLSGYPNGPPVQEQHKRKKVRRYSGDTDVEDDVLLLSSDEEREMQGRLLLCITCSAATHEGCLSDRSTRLLREYVEDGETKTGYQCGSCLRAITDAEKGIPSCEECHQVRLIANLTLSPSKEASKPITEVPDETMGTPGDAMDADNTEDVSATGIATMDPAGLFRCSSCTRGFHYSCLPQFPHEYGTTPSHTDLEAICRKQWKCAECITYTRKPERIITWRIAGDPSDKKLDMTLADASSQPKEFLVRWQDTSYRHLSWVSESWIMHALKNLYARYLKRASDLPHSVENELVPKSWKTIERILTARDKNGVVVEQGSEDQITQVLVKFFDLSYDEVCWDDPPSEETEPELYASFLVALTRYRRACRVRVPEQMKERVEDVRLAASRENYSKHEIKKQPDFIAGGTLMPHQLDGLNWLTYQWEKKLPCILADDMGLGKTIQIVSFLNYLLRKFAIYPFLIVVPNSTASNWLREFAKWAPNMVVVPYYGSSKSRKLSREYELLRGGGSEGKLRCHAVVLTYESANSDISFLSKVKFWPALIVDEAQRLKNDSTQLFQKLKSLKWDHTVLMTGTPLQNNIRELVNIMHFVDPEKFADVEELEKKYSELSKEVVQNLHEQLKPYFLRRTKEMILKTLPPKSEIIVPVTMTALQKEVCRNIMTKNMISFAALSGQTKSSKSKKGLANILMQLRKALNHPYLIPDIEVKQATPEATQRALVEASSKLRVLDQMLPKLIKDGHRILIFSTLRLTLDILEDYLIYEQIKYERLDGTMANLDRVKSIDAFNATGSDVKVFLLTTRAGGVGINLATADTVIMWDFDFNPHSDMQAISRAYRIGQTKPVLVLKFMTRFSVEEKIAQKAKKKMVLDHLVVDKMDEDELEEDDVESILRFGAQALFEHDDDKEITYDASAIDKLLDRSKIVHIDNQTESTAADAAKPMSFSFAKVWSQDTDAPTEELAEDNDAQEKAGNDFWNTFLQEKRSELEAAIAKNEQLGRGARKRAIVRYFDTEDNLNGELKRKGRGRGKGKDKKKQEQDIEADDVYIDIPEQISEDEFANEDQINPPTEGDSTTVPPAQDPVKGKRKRKKAATSTVNTASPDSSQPKRKYRRRSPATNVLPFASNSMNQQNVSNGFTSHHQLPVYLHPSNGTTNVGRPLRELQQPSYQLGTPPPHFHTSQPYHPYYIQVYRELMNLSQQQQPMAPASAQYSPSNGDLRPPMSLQMQPHLQPLAQPHGEHHPPSPHQYLRWVPSQPSIYHHFYPSNPQRSVEPVPWGHIHNPQSGHGSIRPSDHSASALGQRRPNEEQVDPTPQVLPREDKIETPQTFQGHQGPPDFHPAQSHLSPRSDVAQQTGLTPHQGSSHMTSFAATQALMNSYSAALGLLQGQVSIARQETNGAAAADTPTNRNGVPFLSRCGPEKLLESTREHLSALDLSRGDVRDAAHMQAGQEASAIDPSSHPTHISHSSNTSVALLSNEDKHEGPVGTLNISEGVTELHKMDTPPINGSIVAAEPQSADMTATECVLSESTPEAPLPSTMLTAAIDPNNTAKLSKE
ncbi:P-loop containing nucleoside triphosphate hydrolase protein [Dichotomocladium elegans]|nr:P-loop containing nucleoside triphosphate hydrolase protein [Dichotomocladium elegans]